MTMEKFAMVDSEARQSKELFGFDLVPCCKCKYGVNTRHYVPEIDSLVRLVHCQHFDADVGIMAFCSYGKWRDEDGQEKAGCCSEGS